MTDLLGEYDDKVREYLRQEHDRMRAILNEVAQLLELAEDQGDADVIPGIKRLLENAQKSAGIAAGALKKQIEADAEVIKLTRSATDFAELWHASDDEVARLSKIVQVPRQPVEIPREGNRVTLYACLFDHTAPMNEPGKCSECGGELLPEHYWRALP